MNEKNIYTQLAQAQLEFGVVQKGSLNPAFRSRYADLADVAAVVIPTLARHGVAVLHYLEENGNDEWNMVTAFIHGESGGRVECPVPLIINKRDMQGFKSATTYAKRIGLESLSGVAPEDDDGNAASRGAAAAVRPAATAVATLSEEEQAQVTALATEVGADLGLMLAWVAKQAKRPVGSVADIPRDRLNDVMSALNKKRAA
jgi:hypothetical protein